VIESRCEARLVEKHRQERRVFDELGLELLDDDELVEAAGTVNHRQVHDPHPASRNFGNKTVFAECPPRIGQHPIQGTCFDRGPCRSLDEIHRRHARRSFVTFERRICFFRRG